MKSKGVAARWGEISQVADLSIISHILSIPASTEDLFQNGQQMEWQQEHDEEWVPDHSQL